MKKERPITFTIKNECWECTSHRPQSNGYILLVRKNKHIKLHRYIYQLMKGPLSKETNVVMHTCDNRKCMNPKHLIAGTFSDNNKDRAQKGRSAVGSRHGLSKLTEIQVMMIFGDTTTSQSKLAEEFGISQMTISLIKRGKIWQHITKK